MKVRVLIDGLEVHLEVTSPDLQDFAYFYTFYY